MLSDTAAIDIAKPPFDTPIKKLSFQRPPSVRRKPSFVAKVHDSSAGRCLMRDVWVHDTTSNVCLGRLQKRTRSNDEMEKWTTTLGVFVVDKNHRVHRGKYGKRSIYRHMLTTGKCE